MKHYTHFKLFISMYLRDVLKLLERLAINFNLPHAKLTAYLDYYKIELTEDELNYCEYDCMVVDDLIKQQLKQS